MQDKISQCVTEDDIFNFLCESFCHRAKVSAFEAREQKPSNEKSFPLSYLSLAFCYLLSPFQ